uniref:Uncharacterized protein n=1 Tax=Iconisemion striatum TaxID=60296 RepID=A0A1A7XEM8_9TELE
MSDLSEWSEEDEVRPRPRLRATGTCCCRMAIKYCVAVMIVFVIMISVPMPMTKIKKYHTKAVIKGWVTKRKGELKLPTTSCMEARREAFNVTKWKENCRKLTLGCPVPDRGEDCTPQSTSWLKWLKKLKRVRSNTHFTYGLLEWEEGQLRVWDYVSGTQNVTCTQVIYQYGKINAWTEYETGQTRDANCTIFRLETFPNGTKTDVEIWAAGGDTQPPMGSLTPHEREETELLPRIVRRPRMIVESPQAQKAEKTRTIVMNNNKAFSAHKEIPLNRPAMPMTLHVTPRGVKLSFINAPHVRNRSLPNGLTEYYMVIPRQAWEEGEPDRVWDCIRQVTHDEKNPTTWWREYIWNFLPVGAHVRGPYPGLVPKTSHAEWPVNATSKRWHTDVSRKMWDIDVHGLMGHFPPRGSPTPGKTPPYDTLFGEWWIKNLSPEVLKCRPKEKTLSTVFWLANILALLNPATVPVTWEEGRIKGVNMTPPFLKVQRFGDMVGLTLVRSQGPQMSDISSTKAYSEYRYNGMTWGYHSGDLRDTEYDYAYRERDLRLRETVWVRNVLLTLWCNTQFCFRTQTRPSTRIAIKDGKDVYNPYELGGYIDYYGDPHWWDGNWSQYVVWDSEKFPSLGVGWNYYANAKGPRACFCQEDREAAGYDSIMGELPFPAWVPTDGGWREKNCTEAAHFPNKTGKCWLNERPQLSDWEVVRVGLNLAGRGLTVGVKEVITVVARGVVGVAADIVSSIWLYAKVPMLIVGGLIALGALAKLMTILGCLHRCCESARPHPREEEEPTEHKRSQRSGKERLILKSARKKRARKVTWWYQDE